MLKLFKIHIASNRIYGLDILRAFAILFVVVGHGKYLLPEKWAAVQKYFVLDGVSIFFVLSGFLIGGILLKTLEQEKATKGVLLNFWIRRWFRTLPNYFLVLLMLILLSYMQGHGVSPASVKTYFVFAQNLFYNHPGFFPEAWSLSIEEWFYIITPVGIFSIIGLFKTKPKQAVIIVAITILLFTLFYRYYRFITIEVDTVAIWDKTFRKQVFSRLDSLMFGVVAAFIQIRYPNHWLRYKNVLFVFGLGILVVSKYLFVTDSLSKLGFYNCVLSFMVTSLATAILLPFLSQVKSGKGWLYRKMTQISLISYSMYLLNLSVVQHAIINPIPWSSIVASPSWIVVCKYIGYWLLTIGGSVLVYKYYEMPFTKLRDSKWVNQFIERISAKR